MLYVSRALLLYRNDNLKSIRQQHSKRYGYLCSQIVANTPFKNVANMCSQIVATVSYNCSQHAYNSNGISEL